MLVKYSMHDVITRTATDCVDAKLRHW